MVKDIIQIGDKRLLEASEKVDTGEISSGRIQVLIKNLEDTLVANKQAAAGLSAVQLGVLKRVYVVKDLTQDSASAAYKMITLINPKILKVSRETAIEWEGCMSISAGKLRLFGPVSRPRSVKVEYQDKEGNKKYLEWEGFGSHLLQHEQDHLDGVLFLSYIQNPKNIWNEEELDRYLEKNNKFPEVE